jgi:hypothetical protein
MAAASSTFSSSSRSLARRTDAAHPWNDDGYDRRSQSRMRAHSASAPTFARRRRGVERVSREAVVGKFESEVFVIAAASALRPAPRKERASKIIERRL